MSTTKSWVLVHHDTGYGTGLLAHINSAFGGKDMRAESAFSAETFEIQVRYQHTDTTCPKCLRKKARSLQDVLNGLCPRMWAPHDPDAEADCKKYSDLLGDDNVQEEES